MFSNEPCTKCCHYHKNNPRDLVDPSVLAPLPKELGYCLLYKHEVKVEYNVSNRCDGFEDIAIREERANTTLNWGTW